MFQDLFQRAQYSIEQPEKSTILLRELNTLTRFHAANCSQYRHLCAVLWPGSAEGTAQKIPDVPYLPVGLFKSHRLVSVPDGEVFKTLTSSGTTGQSVSRVFLDRETAQRQSNALAAIMRHVLGPRRLPMIVIDSQALLKNRREFTARAAGVLGMLSFGCHHFYALDERMELDVEGLKTFLAGFGQQPFLVFGFTFMVWQYLYRRIVDLGLDWSNGILVHSGGWKKLHEEAVGAVEFKQALRDACGLVRVYNFYGMVEQVGSVFMEGEDGFLYAPNFADVVIRDPITWQEAPVGVPGVIQVLSLLPRSYPGHSLLTEDVGIVHGIDDSPCGRQGKYFSVIGRVPTAELRGCSDTHAFASTSPPR